MADKTRKDKVTDAKPKEPGDPATPKGTLPADSHAANLPMPSRPLGSTLVSGFPTYSKMFENLKIDVPNYSKLFESVNVSGLGNYAELFESVGSVKIPDYSNLFQGVVTLQDNARLLESITHLTGTGIAESSVHLRSDQSAQLRDEISNLRRSAAEHAKSLEAAKSGSERQKREIEQLKKTVEQLKEKERLGFLLDRVHQDSHKPLRHSNEFRAKFLEGQCAAFVLSIDIRRSTELMLKARTPEQFATFITNLCLELTAIVVDSLGVFDKFTGDGILAFFPDFFSGSDAAYRVLMAADKCHAAFNRRYRDSRTSFKSVLTDVGLGIGIDYGSVRLVRVAGGLTVVGEPVVYACRLSSAPSGVTLANQPAFEQISAKVGGRCFAEERSHEIKHEGRMLAYQVRLNSEGYSPAPPDWPSVPATSEGALDSRQGPDNE